MSWQHKDCQIKAEPIVKTLFHDHKCEAPNGVAQSPPPSNKNIASSPQQTPSAIVHETSSRKRDQRDEEADNREAKRPNIESGYAI